MLGRFIDGFFRWSYDFMFRVSHGGRDQWSVRVTANEMSILKNGRPHDQVRLVDVQRIRAVSRNMATRDEIFLLFETDEKRYWVGEYFDGFDVFSEHLKVKFPLRIANWYEELSKSEPFSNSEVLLWER